MKMSSLALNSHQLLMLLQPFLYRARNETTANCANLSLQLQKTRKVIMETLVELMSRKYFEKITINEIAEGANVNRGTIYLHFVDKYDLLNQCVESSLTQLSKYCEIGMAEGVSLKESIERTFEYMEEHAFLYKTLLNNNGVTAFRNKLMDILLLSIGNQMDIRGMSSYVKAIAKINVRFVYRKVKMKRQFVIFLNDEFTIKYVERPYLNECKPIFISYF